MKTTMLSCLCAWIALVVGVRATSGQEMPKPGPEHEKLKKFEGEYDATVSMGGGESKATDSYKMDLGGFWLCHHFKGELGGARFEGRGMTGYDPAKKKYIGIWADSMSPKLYVTEGSFNKEGTLFTETGEMPGPDGKLQKMKSIFELKDKDTMVFTMYQVFDGKDEQMMKITYKRKKK
jgi:hypothetical protein